MVSAVRHTYRRRRPYGTIAVLALLAVGLVWVIVPLSRGESIPSLSTLLDRFSVGETLAAEPSSEPEYGPAEGKVRVFVSGRPIAAYSKVTRDDLWSLAKNDLAFIDLDESFVESAGIIVEAKDIVGRVMANDRSPGYPFTEKDFLPKGTRPGISAGIPAGKRALRIDVDKVHGIVGLQPGDRFDIVAARALDEKKSADDPAFAGLYSNMMNRQRDVGSYRRAKVEVLVQNGIVVSPLEMRAVPTTTTTLTSGTSVKTIPVQEMFIALDPEEVAPLMEAISVEAEVTCLARSGRIDDPVDSITPSSEPAAPAMATFLPGSGSVAAGPGAMAVVETISDTDRALVPVPSTNVESGPEAKTDQ